MRADLSRASEKLGFQPKVPLADGLALTVERDPRFQALVQSV
jgi:nucleoside-diphosphate-sugar epimerase